MDKGHFKENIYWLEESDDYIYHGMHHDIVLYYSLDMLLPYK